MDAGDLIFYGLIAISAVASIVKSVKKKEDKASETGMPDFKGNDPEVHESPEKWLRKILEDRDDDFIPKNPEPVAKPESQQKTASYEGKAAENHSSQEVFRRSNQSQEVFRRSNQSQETYSRTNQSLETMPSAAKFDNGSLHSNSTDKPLLNPAETAAGDLLIPSEDLKNADDLKKAIVYGEIMRTKF